MSAYISNISNYLL